jgi:hypothetical protein
MNTEGNRMRLVIADSLPATELMTSGIYIYIYIYFRGSSQMIRKIASRSDSVYSEPRGLCSSILFCN